MKIVKITLITLLLLLNSTSCSTEPEAEPNMAETAPSTIEVAVVNTATQPPTKPIIETATTQPPTSTATLAPTATTKPTLTPIPTEEPVSDLTNCILCHIDKDLLINTAAPEEEKEPSESSGVG